MASTLTWTPGQAFTGRPHTITWERVWAFSGGPFAKEGWPRRNVHTDPTIAAAFGFQTVVASGTQYQGYVVELLVDTFGDDWLAHGAMKLKFPAVVHAGDTLQAHATLTKIQAQGEDLQVELTVWCENQHGDKVLTGTASGLLPISTLC